MNCPAPVHACTSSILGPIATFLVLFGITVLIRVAPLAGQQNNVEVLSDVQRLAHKVHFVMELKCQPCHGRAKQEGELDLRTVALALEGGQSGPALVQGDADASLIVKRIVADQMPPRGQRYKQSIKPITASELEAIRQWIDDGAMDPPSRGIIDDDGQLVSDEDRQWWSFRPPRSHSIPMTGTLSEGHNLIDVFLSSALEKEGLDFSSSADRQTLIRRLSIDLAGVVPSGGQIEEFLGDPAPNSYEKLVDRLLASARYGERWAQHWLDVSGFAESEGGTDADRIWPKMYQYRDYVIRSMNEDKPYDRFLVEQLAGDELANVHSVERFSRQHRDEVIATGLLRTCMDPTTNPETNFLINRYQVLADTVALVGSSLMGITIRCARCHDHPYDPIPQRDYYRFTAIFAPAYSPYEWVKPLDRFVVLVDKQQQREIEQFNASINQQIEALNAKLASVRKLVDEKYLKKQLPTVPEEIRDKVCEAFAVDEKQRTNEQHRLVAKYIGQLTARVEKLDQYFPDFRRQRLDIEGRQEQLRQELRDLPRAQALTDLRPEADPFFLLERGEWDKRGRQVLPNVPVVLKTDPNEFVVNGPQVNAGTVNTGTTGRRLTLARWLIRADHPLTSRVVVNRIWQHYFNTGIVATADDFGKTGTPATHPRLLDTLAVNFVRQGWSMKQLHRLIVTSRAYRQQSRVRTEAMAVDPGNRLLWRMPMRRMDAETLRDSMLAIAGTMDPAMFGPSAEVKLSDDGQIIYSGSGGQRRSIYLLHRRSTPLTLTEAFDAPTLSTNCVKRMQSTVVSQALLMLNGAFSENQARRLADQVRTQVGGDRPHQLEAAYQTVLGRSATAVEKQWGVEFLSRQHAHYQRASGDEDQSPNKLSDEDILARAPELVDLCLILLNSAEFLYCD